MKIDQNTVRLAGGIFDSDGNPADGDLLAREDQVDGRPVMLVSTADAYPLRLGDVQLAVPVDLLITVLRGFGCEVTLPEDDEGRTKMVADL